MIKHIVMWKLKDTPSKWENATKLKNQLKNLKHNIPEIISINVEIDCSDNNQNYNIILISEFKTMDDLTTYQNHPKHLEVGKFVNEITEKRSCVDYIV